MLGKTAAALALVLALAACGSDSETPNASGASSSPKQIVAPSAPTGASVAVTAPKAGATVGTATELQVAVKGLNLRGGNDGGRILLAFIDKQPKAGERVSRSDDKVQRFSKQSVLLEKLSPGKHTVIVVAANQRGVPLTPLVQASVTFTVDPKVPSAVRSKAPSKPKSGASPKAKASPTS